MLNYFDEIIEDCCLDTQDQKISIPGASEFIDINSNVLAENGARYLMVNIFSYTKQPFYEVPDCFFGWMEKDNLEEGEIFEPKTVKNKIVLSSDSQVSMPCLIDLRDNRIIWLDLSYNTINAKLNNVEYTKSGTALLGQAMERKNIMSIGELLYLHAEAKSWSCVDKGDVDEIENVFTLENLDLNEIMSKYMK